MIAVGKAATAMAQAAHDLFPTAPQLIVTKYDHGHGAPDDAEVIEAAHPVLDDNSLHAGRRVVDVVSQMPPGSHLMMLISGGASALAEAPEEGHDLHSLTARAQALLASGANIQTMNEARRQMSRIKGGKLLSRFCGDRVTTLCCCQRGREPSSRPATPAGCAANA